jgi:hypothetical protein
MKLTHAMRSEFVAKVMSDVPFVNYAEQAEQLAHAMLKDMWKEAFPGVDYAEVAAWFDTNTVYMPGSLSNVYAVAPGLDTLKNSPDRWAQLVALEAKYTQEETKHAELEASLHAAAKSATTLKQLMELLPAFVKYMPSPSVDSRKVPAVAQIEQKFADAGWPKGEGTKS